MLDILTTQGRVVHVRADLNWLVQNPWYRSIRSLEAILIHHQCVMEIRGENLHGTYQASLRWEGI